MCREGRIERAAGVAPARLGRRERTSDDHLGGRVRPLALRVSRRHSVARRPEERVCAIDAIVDDPDLDPVPSGREPGPPERRRADEAGAGVERGGVADARIDLGHTRTRPQSCELRPWQHDGQAVEHGPVSPAHLGLRDVAEQAVDELALAGGRPFEQHNDLRDAGRRAYGSAAAREGRERPCEQRNDHEEEDPPQAEHRTHRAVAH